MNLPNGVVVRSADDGRAAPAEDLSGYQVVRAGDLVMNQLGKPHGALGVSAVDGIISPAYFVAEIGADASPRFIHHLLRTRLYISEYERRGKFMPPSQFDISWEQFRSIDIALPPLSEQGAIADYLDTETARIDALITKKRRMIELLDERWQAEVGDALTSTDRPLRLKQLLRSRPSYGVLVPRFVEPGEGVSFIRAGDLLGLSNSQRSDLVEIDWTQSAEYRRTTVSAGDLLVSVVGTMGRAVVVAEEFSGANIARAVCRLQPLYPADGELLWLWITATQAFLNQARLVTDGDTAQPTLNVGDLCEFKLGVSHDPEVRAVLAQRLTLRSQQVIATRTRLGRQIDLLIERRQALITAAVTGELEIPGVAA